MEKIVTDIHVGLTYRHQYLHFVSKRSVFFSQILHISRLCSNESDFEQNKKQMRSWFVKREYPEKLIDSEIRNVKINIKETNRKNKSKNEVPFAVTYHLPLNCFNGIIRKLSMFLMWIKRFRSYTVHNPWCLFVVPVN